MSYYSGEPVEVSHFSVAYMVKACIDNMEPDDIVGIRVNSCIPMGDFSPGDPVAMTYKLEDQVVRCECTIISVESEKRHFSARIESESKYAERREFERFPVSLCAKLFTQSGDINIVYIKDVSLNGMGVVSNFDYEVGQNVKLSFYIEDEKLSLDLGIVWKVKKELNNHYGLKLVNDKGTDMLKTYIREIKK